MVDTRSDSVHILNHLIQSLKDAELGFAEASQDLREEAYRKELSAYARQMANFGTTLREQVTRLGGKTPDSGTVSGHARRIWMHLRAMMNLHHKETILLEGEKMEESLLDHFEKALEALSPDLREIVEKQCIEIIQIRNHLLELTSKGPLSADEKKFLI